MRSGILESTARLFGDSFDEHAIRVDFFADETDFLNRRHGKFSDIGSDQQLKTGGVLNGLDGFAGEGLDQAHPFAGFLEVEDALGGDQPVRAFALACRL